MKLLRIVGNYEIYDDGNEYVFKLIKPSSSSSLIPSKIIRISKSEVAEIYDGEDPIIIFKDSRAKRLSELLAHRVV